MPTRPVSLVPVLLGLLFFAFPASSQQTATIANRINQRVQQHEDNISRVSAAPELDPKVARMQMLQHDVAELSALNVSVQSDLQMLQKGVLAKGLNEDLKKLEKLSKKVRHEVE